MLVGSGAGSEDLAVTLRSADPDRWGGEWGTRATLLAEWGQDLTQAGNVLVPILNVDRPRLCVCLCGVGGVYTVGGWFAWSHCPISPGG